MGECAGDEKDSSEGTRISAGAGSSEGASDGKRPAPPTASSQPVVALTSCRYLHRPHEQSQEQRSDRNKHPLRSVKAAYPSTGLITTALMASAPKLPTTIGCLSAKTKRAAAKLRYAHYNCQS